MIKGCGVIVHVDGKFLIGKRSDDLTWCSGGGHIEDGESPREAARRELFEEFGVTGILMYLGKVTGPGYTSECFYTHHINQQPRLVDRGEILTTTWVRLEDLHNYQLFEPFKLSLNLYTQKMGL